MPTPRTGGKTPITLTVLLALARVDTTAAAGAPLTGEKHGGHQGGRTYSTLRVSLASDHNAKNPPWETPAAEEQNAKVLYVPGCSAQNPPTFAQSEPVAANELATAYTAYSDHLYIITLRRDARRLSLIINLTRVLTGANIVWAIDGRAQVTDEVIAMWQRDKYLRRTLRRYMDPNHPVGRPKIACLMSHLRVWEQLANHPDPHMYYIMMEDDVFLMPRFAFRLHAIVQELSVKDTRWEWVYLAVHPKFAHHNVATIKGMRHLNTAPRMAGNAAYLISRRGARNILRHATPFGEPKDEAVNHLVCQRTLRAYIVKTPLVGVRGQQGQGFERSLRDDPARVLRSNIWDS